MKQILDQELNGGVELNDAGGTRRSTRMKRRFSLSGVSELLSTSRHRLFVQRMSRCSD